MPLTRWLRGPLRTWAEARVGTDRLRAVGIDPGAALALLEEHGLRQADHARPLWALVRPLGVACLDRLAGQLERAGVHGPAILPVRSAM